MFDNFEILNLSTDIARHASVRQSLVARNIANANTPGYRSLDIGSFEARDTEFLNAFKRTRSSHLELDANARWDPRERLSESKPNGNAVSLQGEMVKAAEIRHRHQMAVSVYGTAMDILRSSLGRR